MIIMLAVYSVSIFFVDTWWGMAAFAALVAVALGASRVPVRGVLTMAVPLYVIAGLTVFFNAFQGPEGGFAFTAPGLERGCFFAARIVLLVWMSLILCLVASATELTRAFESLLAPARRLGVPVDDVASVFSIALRFIPLLAKEFLAVRDAQWSRGAPFDEGPLFRRVRAHLVIFIPLFVGLFRRADRLALAMDARCYGAPGVVPTALRRARVSAASIAWTAAVGAFCVGVAIVF